MEGRHAVGAMALLLTLASAAGAAAQDGTGDAPPASDAADTPAETAAPENLEAAQEARRHFMAGIESFRQHHYRQAIQSFQLAAQLVPSADLWFNIARAHEELSEYEPAIDHYRLYLRDRVDPPDREQIEAHIEALTARAAAMGSQVAQPTSGLLRLSANHDGTLVTLDGAEASASPWEGPRELPAGRHRLSLTREGYVPFHSEVSVEPGMTTAAYADLVPETRYRSIRNERIFTWIAWGLGVVSLGVSIGLGVEAASRQTSDIDSARTWAAFSDGALAGAIGFGVLGAILYFLEGRAVDTERLTVEEEASPSRVRGLEAEAP